MTFKGKVPDLAGLTAEHLQRTHPVLPVIKAFSVNCNGETCACLVWSVTLFLYPSRKTMLANHRLVRILEAQLSVPSLQKFLNIAFYKNLATIFTQTASSLVLRKALVAIMRSVVSDVL